MNQFSSDFETISSSWWPYIIAFFVTIISVIRFYVGGTKCDTTTTMNGKVVIITGGAAGIGYETAKNLAKRGATLILAVRHVERGKLAVAKLKQQHSTTTTSGSITIKLLDVSESSSIKKFVEQIKSEYEQVDVLINNAAIIYQPFEKNEDGYEKTIFTNYLGPFLLTHLLLPLLNKSENGRVINVSAMAHYNGKLHLDDLNMERSFNEKDAFSQSKLALTMFTKYFANILKNTKITCNSVSPGLVRDTEHLKNLPLQRSTWSKITVLPWMWLFLKTPEQGCQSVVYLAVEPSLNKISGRYFSDCEIKEPAETVKDMELNQKLYEISCEMLKINGDKLVDCLNVE